MVKHIRLLPTNCLSVFDHFVELALIGLTYNLQLYLKRGSGIDFFLWILWIFLRTSFLWNTSWKLLLKGEFYENWWPDIFFYKEISWNLQLFQRTDVAREGEVCESHFIKGNIVLTRNFLYMLVKRRQNPWNIPLKRFYFL